MEDQLYGGTVAIAPEPESVLLPGHDVPLGRYTAVRRLLPQRQTWLVNGEIVHRDSLGSNQSIRPGQLNLMSSGHGIAHSEMSPPEHPPGMHGLQLWVALPEEERHGEPRFEHHADLPILRDGDATLTVLAGRYRSAKSPAGVHTPLVAVEMVLPGPGSHRLSLEPAFDYGVLTMSGAVDAGDVTVTSGSLLYLAPGRSELTVEAPGGARVFLFGGKPFEEDLVMWWNFVGRSHE